MTTLPKKDIEGFLQLIEKSLFDGILTRDEWRMVLSWAGHHGLAVEEAERFLLARCVEEGAIIEELETRRLQELVAIVGSNKVLDRESRAMLQGWLKERYHNSTKENLQSYIDGLLAGVLSTAGIHDETEIRQGILKDLHSLAGRDKCIRNEDWQRLYRNTLAAITVPGGDAPDLVHLFLDCRRELGIVISEPVKPADPTEQSATTPLPLEVEALAAPTPETSTLPQKKSKVKPPTNPKTPPEPQSSPTRRPDPPSSWQPAPTVQTGSAAGSPAKGVGTAQPPSGRPSLANPEAGAASGLVSFLRVALICLVVAAVVFFSLRLAFGPAVSGTAGTGIPPCDADCTTDLQASIDRLRQTDVLDPEAGTLLEGIWSACSIYLFLPAREQAEAEFPGWRLCRDESIRTAHEERARRDAAGPNACEELAHCLELFPENTACAEARARKECTDE